jgi:hypothetical protein
MSNESGRLEESSPERSTRGRHSSEGDATDFDPTDRYPTEGEDGASEEPNHSRTEGDHDAEAAESDHSVSELQATVDALRADLVDATERIRELEAATNGVTPGGRVGGTDATADSSDTATGSVDPGSLDALSDGSVDDSGDVTVGDLDADGGDETPGMPGRDPTQHPQNTQDAELVDASSRSDSGSDAGSSDGSDESATTTTDSATAASSETTEEDDEDDSDDIIVA